MAATRIPRGWITSAIAALVLSSLASACYYQALDLENPADYYYRYCYAGCTALTPGDAPYKACCTPLPAGSAPPQTCADMSKSHEAAGTTCQFGAVPTTDFPQDYNYAPTTSWQPTQTQSTQTEGGAVTVWVTSTSTTPCPASPTPAPPAPTPTAEYSHPPEPVPSPEPTPEPCDCPSGEGGGYRKRTENEDACVCSSSGKLSEPTWSDAAPEPSPTPEYTPPAPPPSSYEPTPTPTPEYTPEPTPEPTYVHSEAPAPSPSVTLTEIKPPCASNTPGLIYGSYAPSCSGTDCHVGDAAPSGYTPDGPHRRNQPEGCPHVGDAPSGDVSIDNGRKRRGVVPMSTPTPAATHTMVGRGGHKPVVGFEPKVDARAVSDGITHAPISKTMARRELPLVTTVIQTITGTDTFYSCSDGWVLTSLAGGPGPSPSVTGAPLIPSITSGVGEAQETPLKRNEATSTIVLTQTVYPTQTTCPKIHPSHPSAPAPSPTASGSYLPGPHPSGSTCYCQPGSAPHAPSSSSAVGALIPSYSGSQGIGNAPSQSVSIIVDRRMINARYNGLEVCPCDCGVVVSVSPAPSATPSATHSQLVNPSGYSGIGDVPSSSVPIDNDRRALPTAARIALPPRGYIAVEGGFAKRDVPPSDWTRPEAVERGLMRPPTTTRPVRREAPPQTVTSTTWITTDDCKPTGTPDDEECDEDDYSLTYDEPTSSGKLSEATSSAALFSHAPEPSDAHIGDGTVPEGFQGDAPERRWWRRG